MSTVVINMLNLNVGGGRSIRDSFLRLLDADRLAAKYVVLVAKGTDPGFISNVNIELVELPGYMSKTLAAPFVYRFALGPICRRYGASVILNFCDVIITTPIRQIYVLDFPYVFDVHPKVYENLSLWYRALIRTKVLLHEWQFHFPRIVVAQTEDARRILLDKYALSDVRVVGNAVTLVTGDAEAAAEFQLPAKRLFLCPCTYHPHKNVEVLLDVAEEIKRRNLPVAIVTTIDPVSPAAASFLQSIKDRRLGDYIVNLGQQPVEHMCALYRRCDAMLMPTLLESFSISYVEAMHYRLPIVTSDMWFARAVCGDAAIYVDALDPRCLADAVETIDRDADLRQALIERGLSRVAELPGWPQIYAAFQALIDELLREAGQVETPAAGTVRAPVGAERVRG